MNAFDAQLEELKHLKEELERSPLFSASLGSKELFHSNLIAWMCERWPGKMGEVFSRLLREEDKPIEIDGEKKPLREQANYDLQIQLKGGRMLVIELKVKSLPREDQLAEYKAKWKGPNDSPFLLLTFLDPGFRVPEDWRHATLTKFSNALKALLLPTIDGQDDAYERGLINDYIGLVNNLSGLKEAFKQNQLQESVPLKGIRDYLRLVVPERLHDLFEKHLASSLGEWIKQKIKIREKTPELMVTHGSDKVWYDEDLYKRWYGTDLYNDKGEKPPILKVGYSTGRKGASVELKHHLPVPYETDEKHHLEIGIELAGNVMTVFMVAKFPEIDKGRHYIARKMLNTRFSSDTQTCLRIDSPLERTCMNDYREALWFTFDPVIAEVAEAGEERVYGESGLGGDIFNQYGVKHKNEYVVFYKYVNMETKTLENIINIFAAYHTLILERRTAIIKAYTDCERRPNPAQRKTG